MEDKDAKVHKSSRTEQEKDTIKQTIKEKRLDQRRKIEELMEEKRLKFYTENYDYYFAE